MPSLFAITCDRTLDLTGKKDGEITITISNQSGRSLQAQATVEALDAPLKGAVAVSRGDPKWEFADKGTHQVTVSVKPTPATPPGQYKFRLKVVNVEKPDEEGQDGPEVQVVIPKPATPGPKPFPWWILIVVGAVILVGVVVTWLALRGEPEFDVPNVVGKPLKEAEKMLEEAGLKAVEKDKVVTSPNKSIKAGEVAVQDPAPPTKVKKGEEIGLHVLGATNTVRMPNFVGLTATTLIGHLQGFTVGMITTKDTRTRPEGTVLSQEPAANTEVTPETKINLVFEGKPTVIRFSQLVAPTHVDRVPAALDAHKVVPAPAPLPKMAEPVKK